MHELKTNKYYLNCALQSEGQFGTLGLYLYFGTILNMMLECLNGKKYRCIHMNKFYFNLQSAFLFVGGTRDVIFKIKSRSRHQGHGERKKMHMLHGQKCNGVHLFSFLV